MSTISGIAFSKNRAAQLHLLLQSLTVNAPTLLDRVTVIWKATDQKHLKAYHLCEDEHPEVLFQRETDFRRQVEREVAKAGRHTCFLVDDDIFWRRHTELVAPGNFLNQHPDALTVSLRLGLKHTECYPLQCKQRLPKFMWRAGMYAFSWSSAQYDYGYPGSLDGGIFRTNQLRALIHGGSWSSPNTLEEWLNAQATRSSLALIGCYKKSLLLGNPVNIVQSTHPNRHGEEHGVLAETLNDRYLAGERLRVDDLCFPEVRAAHVEVDLLNTAKEEAA